MQSIVEIRETLERLAKEEAVVSLHNAYVQDDRRHPLRNRIEMVGYLVSHGDGEFIVESERWGEETRSIYANFYFSVEEVGAIGEIDPDEGDSATHYIDLLGVVPVTRRIKRLLDARYALEAGILMVSQARMCLQEGQNG